MSLRVAAGLAAWLGLGVMPVAHLGWTPPSAAGLIPPLLALFSTRAGILFPAALLPLYLIEPDLCSPRTHRAAGMLASAGLLAAYLIVALRDPLPRTAPARAAGRRPDRGLASAPAAAAVVVCAGALCVPFFPEVALAVRDGHPASPGAAATLLAIGCLALASGLVVVYLAAPLFFRVGRRA
jgi:hypothetical protein